MEAATLILALTFIAAGATALIAAVTDARCFSRRGVPTPSPAAGATPPHGSSMAWPGP